MRFGYWLLVVSKRMFSGSLSGVTRPKIPKIAP